MNRENPLDIQVGGNHYKNLPYQPIRLIVKIGCSFIQGCIIKYISRYKFKNGKQDIEKCIHYAQLAIELKHQGYELYGRPVGILLDCAEYAQENSLSPLQKRIVIYAARDKYRDIVDTCKFLIKKEYPNKVD